jgi:trimethylamine:corrinoid methyltransferase-like protein
MFFSPSPMILDADDLYLCFQNGITLNRFMVGSMPMMGMTGPIDPIGVYILGIAEVLGAASVLHAIFPDAQAYVYPHPQAMSLQSGRMAFGTVEHARLEMMKIIIMDVLGLQYYNLKDIMTSAQMPGSMAQGDKALGFYSGIIAGYRAYNLMPLSTDQVWSPEQALLDIENLQNAWKVLQPINTQETSEICGHIESIIDAKMLFSESDHTLLHMHEHYDLELLQKRYFTSETWMSAGKPDEIAAIEEKKDGFISLWDYHPPQDKLEKVIDIYNGLCKRLNAEPLNLD